MKLITKGTWYYEIQIAWFVFMWRHTDYHPEGYLNMKWKRMKIGRLLVWIDTAWTYHGPPQAIREFWHDLTKNVSRFKRLKAKLNVLRINAKNMFNRWIVDRKVVKFWLSLLAYMRLNKAGFEIGYWSDPVFTGKYTRYRFFWKGRMIREFPDVTWVGDDWKMMNNGHVSYMPSNTIRGIKHNSFYQDEFRTNHDGHDI